MNFGFVVHSAGEQPKAFVDEYPNDAAGGVLLEISWSDGSSLCIHRLKDLDAVKALAISILAAVDAATARQKPFISDEPATEQERQQILDALDMNTWTETRGTHSELPDHLKPKRHHLWDAFESGETPESLARGSGASVDEKAEMQLEETRWKLAGGKVKQ